MPDNIVVVMVRFQNLSGISENLGSPLANKNGLFKRKPFIEQPQFQKSWDSMEKKKKAFHPVLY